MYKDFVEASRKIEEILLSPSFSFSRTKPPVKTEIEFSPSPGLKTVEMKTIFLGALKKLDPLVKLPRQMVEKTISLQQKIFDLKGFIDKQKKIGFKNLVQSAQNRTEVIVHFLAILELLKQRHLKVKQSKTFEDILIEKL